MGSNTPPLAKLDQEAAQRGCVNFRATRLDKHSYPDHYYFDPNDKCIYLLEYTSRKGYQHSPANQFILNFKKCPSKKNTSQYQYKKDAIVKASAAMTKCLKDYNLSHTLFVPIPPSKSKNSSLHDDRLIQTLDNTKLLPYKEIVTQRSDTQASHGSEDRSSIKELESLYDVNIAIVNEINEINQIDFICIFDDVITTGAHYMAMKNKLKPLFPEATFVGVFLARAIRQSDFGEPSDA